MMFLHVENFAGIHPIAAGKLFHHGVIITCVIASDVPDLSEI